MEQLIAIKKQNLEQIHEALEIALLMFDEENQPPQYTINEVMPKIETTIRFALEALDKKKSFD